jgi:catalase
MSDRALPRSLRMMEGFGVHTFRLVNENLQMVILTNFNRLKLLLL